MTSTYCLMIQNICQTGPGQQLRTLLGLTMMVMLTGLLFLGFIVEHKMAGQAGHLPKPIIWAEPGSVIALHTPVIIWCQGSWEAQEYRLYKEQNGYPWDTQFPLETKNKAKFNIQHTTTDYAGIYKCYFRTSVGHSQHSDAMKLVVTGEWMLWEPCMCLLLRRRSVLWELFSQSPVLEDNINNSCSFHILHLVS
ncbi:leukocyte immunoglobulin-like receptor subfamily B member 4A [Apodemus sylvaticus]|uniref:leukocyte immunoglobulin-like receptor subfamily B member 4A n=1 Tax=Apodemus sylvaticus TaxID=10129 RepID=UPI0022425E9C|nr:leukocyte immunoglobulin-like receptor subfamily B member 4A [Apodemus sylvaticus]